MGKLNKNVTANNYRSRARKNTNKYRYLLNIMRKHTSMYRIIPPEINKNLSLFFLPPNLFLIELESPKI